MAETSDSERPCVVPVGLDASVADPLLELVSGNVAGQQSLLEEGVGSAWHLEL